MIFADKRNFGIVTNDFLNSYKIAYATFGSILTAKGNTPPDSTAIDQNTSIALIKCYHEYLERSQIGLNIQNNKECIAINYIDNSLYQSNLNNYGYGYSMLYGNVDTTGTGAGLNSKQLIHLSILELLEKNEMLLFWFLKKGMYIIKDMFIKNKITKLGFSSKQIEIFYIKELSNFPTYFVILIDNNRVIASGCGIADTDKQALTKALEEARLLEWQNKNNSNSSLVKLSANEHKLFIQHINNLINYMPHKQFNNTISEELQIATWIKSLEFRVINIGGAHSSVIIKCISKELFNCLPKLNNLKLSINKEICKVYNLNYELLKEYPECILL